MARMGKLGWFLGLIFGTIFGVLFAPRKGKDLRARMKAERKRGKGLGLAPLQDDMKHLGQEIAEIFRDLYDSEAVRDVVVKGRKKIKELSDDLVGEVADFHTTRIAPIERKGEKTFKKAKKQFHSLKGKVKSSTRIGKRAFNQVKRVFKKKSP